MRSNDAEAPRGIISELRAVLDGGPADEPRHELRQSLQLLVPLLEQRPQRLQALEMRLEALDPAVADPTTGRPRRRQRARELGGGRWRVDITTSVHDL
jgi:hypothetical protein